MEPQPSSRGAVYSIERRAFTELLLRLIAPFAWLN
jgi:hypothetical protein